MEDHSRERDSETIGHGRVNASGASESETDDDSRSTRYDHECLCHCHEAAQDAHLTRFTAISWEKLRRAAEVRQDGTWEKLEGEWERGPWGAYHRQCYQTYTHKKLLARLKKRRSEEGTSIPTSAYEVLDCTPKAGPANESGHYLLRKNLRSNQALNTDKRMCIICQKDKRNTRNHGRNEPLSVCTNLKDTLLKAAKLHQDDRIIMQLESVLDNVAADVLYHRSWPLPFRHLW